MIAQIVPPDLSVVATLDDLDPVSTHALRLLRMWSWGVVHRETIRLAAPTQFGATHGICVVGAFESLFAVLEAMVPELAIRPPDSARLSEDEVWFLCLVSEAAIGPPSAAMPRAAERVSPEASARIAESAAGFAQLLARCLEQQQRAAPKACPIACPIQNECVERPKLEVVR